MKILIFTEGTILMHRDAIGHTRSEIVQQVREKNVSVHNYATYVPIGNSVKKISRWKSEGHYIYYMTSRRDESEIDAIRSILKKYNFPNGELVFRKETQEYEDVAEHLMPDILIEDDCESIGADEITFTHINPKKQDKIRSILVPEFGGIDHLPDII